MYCGYMRSIGVPSHSPYRARANAELTVQNQLWASHTAHIIWKFVYCLLLMKFASCY